MSSADADADAGRLKKTSSQILDADADAGRLKKRCSQILDADADAGPLEKTSSDNSDDDDAAPLKKTRARLLDNVSRYLTPQGRAAALSKIHYLSPEEEAELDKEEDEFYNVQIPDDALATYKKQVEESDGYDVDWIPGGERIGMIVPFDDFNHQLYTNITQGAIDHHNNNNNKGEKLELVKILQLNVQIDGCPIMYITLEARDSNGCTKTYQTRIVNPSTVEQFREKPAQQTKQGC